MDSAGAPVEVGVGEPCPACAVWVRAAMTASCEIVAGVWVGSPVSSGVRVIVGVALGITAADVETGARRVLVGPAG